MKKLAVIFSIVIVVIVILSFGPNQATGAYLPANNDSLEKDRAKYVKLVNERIKGKEKMAVDSVFLNLKVLGGFPAENLVVAMNSWSRALGVSCGHCHDTGNFADDKNLKKEIAREMVTMGNMISTKLKSINGISKRPIVNCTTCHRGELKPAFRLTEK